MSLESIVNSPCKHLSREHSIHLVIARSPHGGDEAIQHSEHHHGLLRFARNDELSHWKSLWFAAKRGDEISGSNFPRASEATTMPGNDAAGRDRHRRRAGPRPRWRRSHRLWPRA